MIKYDKNFTYLLGYLWSDGHIERYRSVLEIIEEDALCIIDDIKKISFLKICTMKRQRKGRKPQMSIYFCDSKFHDSYMSRYFINKSISAPISLLDDIPEDLRRYFYLGLVDGDGCFYFKNKTRQFVVSSSYDQDWTHVENLFKYLNIKQYEIRRTVNKNESKNSIIRVKKYNEIESIYNYLYPNGYEIGLKRKFDKCKEIIDNKPKNSSNKSKIDIDDLRKNIESGLPIIELSKIYECNWRKIFNCCKINNIKYGKGFFLGIYDRKSKVINTNKFLSFEDARLYVNNLKLKSQKEWNIYSKLHRPINIPSNPSNIYKNIGWLSWGNWLGY